MTAQCTGGPTVPGEAPDAWGGAWDRRRGCLLPPPTPPGRCLNTLLPRPPPQRRLVNGSAELSSQPWRPFWATRVACGVLDASTWACPLPAQDASGGAWGAGVVGQGQGALCRPGQQPVPPGGRGQAVTSGRPAACLPGLPQTWGSARLGRQPLPGRVAPHSPSSADDSGSSGSSLQGP